MISADVVHLHKDVIANMEGQGLHATLIGRLGHSFMGVLHTITEEGVQLVKVDSIVASTKIGNLST